MLKHKYFAFKISSSFKQIEVDKMISYLKTRRDVPIRRARTYWTRDEINTLVSSVGMIGTDWNLIKQSYFKKSFRTIQDLRHKFKSICDHNYAILEY